MQFKLNGKLGILISMLLIAAFMAACQPAPAAGDDGGDDGAATTEPTEAAGGADGDLLAAITERGTLIVATDPAYPPQSELVEDGSRTEGTKCSEDQLTAGELEGFD